MSQRAIFLLHHVRAGDAKVDTPGGKFARDFTGGEKNELDAVDAVDAARILAVGAGAGDGHAARAEPVEGVGHEAALGRDAKFDRHAAAPSVPEPRRGE